MDEQPQVVHESQFQTRSGVSFPQAPAPKPKKKNLGLKIGVLALLLLLIGGIAYFLLSNDNPFSGVAVSPTPTVSMMNQLPTDTPVPTMATVSKSELKIQVLNGTGVPGEASFLQKELEKLGFSGIEAGNADTKGATKTDVAFSSRVPDDVKTEVTAKLQELYSSVDVSEGASAGIDITVTTGPRKGQKVSSGSITPTPTTKLVQGAKTSVTVTPTKSVTGTIAPTVSTTVTPTKPQQ